MKSTDFKKLIKQAVKEAIQEELFGLTYAPEAAAKRKRLTSLEQAQFAGQSGMTGGALSRERAGSF